MNVGRHKNSLLTFVWCFIIKLHAFSITPGHSLLTSAHMELLNPYIQKPELVIREFPYASYQIYFVPNQGWYYIDRVGDCIKRILSQGTAWDTDHIRKLVAYIKPGTIALDIGAYIGTHTVNMAKFITNSGLIISFEPQEKIFRELMMNARLNNCRNVLPLRCAVGNTNGTAYLGIPIDNNEAARYISKKNQVELVPLQTIDYFNLSNVSFIKISAENSELDVLEGAYQTIMRNRPIIFIKIQSNQLKAAEDQVNMKETANLILSKLQEWRYQIEFLECSTYIAFPAEKPR